MHGQLSMMAWLAPNTMNKWRGTYAMGVGRAGAELEATIWHLLPASGISKPMLAAGEHLPCSLSLQGPQWSNNAQQWSNEPEGMRLWGWTMPPLGQMLRVCWAVLSLGWAFITRHEKGSWAHLKGLPWRENSCGGWSHSHWVWSLRMKCCAGVWLLTGLWTVVMWHVRVCVRGQACKSCPTLFGLSTVLGLHSLYAVLHYHSHSLHILILPSFK